MTDYARGYLAGIRWCARLLDNHADIIETSEAMMQPRILIKKEAPTPEGIEAPIVVDSQLELPGIR